VTQQELVQDLWHGGRAHAPDVVSFAAESDRWLTRAALRVGALLCGVFLVVGLALARSTSAAPASTDWQLVTRINQGEYVSFVSNPDGSDLRQLAVENEPVLRFECSPDGSKFAFVTLGRVHVARADGGDHRSVFDPILDEYAYFSLGDDGQYVAFSSSYYSGKLWLADMTSGTSIPLLDRMMDYSTSAVSPDGTRLMISAGYRNQNPGLYLLDIDTPNAMTMIGEGIAPVWSPDGSMVVYSQFDGVQADLYLMDMTRGTTVRLTYTPDNENGAAWSPDGQQIVFVTYEGYANDTRITLMGWDGTNRRDVEALRGHFSPCILRERPQSLLRPVSTPSGR
jgi:Tol biopolymer transport system component